MHKFAESIVNVKYVRTFKLYSQLDLRVIKAYDTNHLSVSYFEKTSFNLTIIVIKFINFFKLSQTDGFKQKHQNIMLSVVTHSLGEEERGRVVTEEAALA